MIAILRSSAAFRSSSLLASISWETLWTWSRTARSRVSGFARSILVHEGAIGLTTASRLPIPTSPQNRLPSPHHSFDVPSPRSKLNRGARLRIRDSQSIWHRHPHRQSARRTDHPALRQRSTPVGHGCRSNSAPQPADVESWRAIPFELAGRAAHPSRWRSGGCRQPIDSISDRPNRFAVVVPSRKDEDPSDQENHVS